MSKPGFSGGLKMQAALSHLQKQLGSEPRLVRVGFLEGSECGRDRYESAPSIAFILEGGAPAANIPPRPFFRKMINRRQATWSKILLAFLKTHSYDVRLALKGVGLRMGEELQVEMIELQDPPNAQSTITRKGFNNPLIDSRNLLRSIEFEVEGGEKGAPNGSA